MRQVIAIVALLSGLVCTGTVVAADDMEEIRAECTAQAEEQGATDTEAYVTQCVNEKTQAPAQAQ